MKKCPCSKCTRVSAPRECERKTCMVWRTWFLDSWKQFHSYWLRYGKK